jgi:hypothetical protein
MRAGWMAGFLIALLMAQGFFASRSKSPTSDEPPHIAAGVQYLDRGEFTLNLQHPPLLKEMAAVFLLGAGVRWPIDTLTKKPFEVSASTQEWELGDRIVGDNGPERVLFWARLPFILLTGVLGLVIFLWGRRMLGDAAALGALFLLAFDPTIVAHSYLVTTDVGFAAFATLFLFALWSYLQSPSNIRLILAGLALGAAMGAKFSGVFLPPLAGLLLVTAAVRERSPEALTRRIVRACIAFAAMALIAALVIQSLYSFKDPLLYFKGLQSVNADHHPDYEAFLAGNLQKRFLTYYLAAYSLKEPLSTILLAGIGLVFLLRSRKTGTLNIAFLLAPPAVLFLAYTVFSDNLGVRYIIPVLPFLYLIGGMGLAALLQKSRAVAALLCVWVIVAAAGIYPDHLSYFNEMACALNAPGDLGMDGGSRCGTRWLDDSNVDWGQGLPQLKEWLAKNGNGRMACLAYFGSFPPFRYAVPYENCGLDRLMVEKPSPGLYAVSAHLVARLPALGPKLRGGDAGKWLRTTRPTAIVGHAYYIYDVR